MATDDVSRNDNEVIVVTLVCRPHGSLVSDIPKRQFVLSNQNPSIRIGRASKVPTKGFVASIDNSWFDSPVMSRNHAELTLDLDSIPKSVIIKDIGSLHGTFHTPHDGVGKEMRLEQHRPIRLSNGDSLRFGTDIFRSKETYPPCSVEFYMIEQEHEPRGQDIPTTNQSPNRTFTIPDDDLDDDDDDDGSVIETSMPPSHKTNVQRGLSIDLTQDEDDSEEDKNLASSTTALNHLNSDIIDLTSEPDKHSVHEAHEMSSIHYSASSTGAILQESSAMAAELTASGYTRPESKDQSERPVTYLAESDTSSEDSHLFAPSEELSSDIHLTDSENDSVITGEDDASSIGEDFDDDDSFTSEHNNGIVQSESWEDDNESILPYSESDDDSSSAGDEMMDTLSDSSSRAPSSSPYSSPNPPVPNALPSTDAFVEPSNTDRHFVPPFLFTTAAQQESSVSQPREPSPSDAAMFKSHPVLDRISISRAQALGDKSGKHAYFAARERNRANNFNWLSPPPVSAIRETLGLDTDQNSHAGESSHDSRPALPAVQVEETQKGSAERNVDTDTVSDPKVHASTAILEEELVSETTWQPWAASGERFINHPHNEELPYSYPERPQSPELDMTSAYTFQLSKIASESGSGLAIKPRRVEIQDLLSQEPNGDKNDMHRDHFTSPAPPVPCTVSSVPLPPEEAVSGPCVKRSFEDAFGNDVDVLESSKEPTHQENEKLKSESASEQTRDAAVTGIDSNDTAVSNTLREKDIEAQPTTVPARRDNVQPSKRRRFAQAAAYVALGGAAALTYMVSTAPVL